MQINYDKNTNKVTVKMTWFDRVINLLIILVICGGVLYGVFKPDLKSLIPERPQKETTEEVVFSGGNELSWSEYRSIIGNKKLMKQYVKQKSVVTGYLVSTPVKSSSDYYEAVIVESENAEDSTGILLRFSNKKDAEKIKAGPIAVMDTLSTDSYYAFFYVTNPVIISN